MGGRALAAGILSLVLLGGCSWGGRDVAASLEPRASLAAKAVLAAVNHLRGDATAGGKSASTVEPDSAPAGVRGSVLARAEDPRGDQGAGPEYADLVNGVFTDSGDRLAVALTLGAVVPGRLGRGELEEVGIDLFRISPLDALLGHTGCDDEIRLEGDASGWRAFLRTQDGYVAFPGTFTVDGPTLRVVLPWRAVGGRRRADAEPFVDWSSGVGRLATDGATRVHLSPDG